MGSSPHFRPGLAAIASAALLAGCAKPPAPGPPVPRVAEQLLPFLADPAEDCPAAGDLAAEASSISRRLRLSGDSTWALARAAELRERDPASLAARVLRAQALVVAGRASEAFAGLQGSDFWLPECLPLSLIYGRAAEEAGELLEAYLRYGAASALSETASARMTALSAAAIGQGRRRFLDELAKGHVERTAMTAETLLRLWPQSEAALRSVMELGEALGDANRELAAVRALQVAAPDDPALKRRRGRLEIECGDARTGLRLIEDLAAQNPRDAGLAAELARARFEWRLLNAPEPVRRLRHKPGITRGELAMLIYWMVPQTRTARPVDGRIASDVLEHHGREEIVRIVNLGVMSVDETLHRFAPDAPLRRGEAVAALVRLLRIVAGPASCAGDRESGREGICAAAQECALAADAADCQSGAALSGRDAVDLLAATLDRIGSD